MLAWVGWGGISEEIFLSAIGLDRDGVEDVRKCTIDMGVSRGAGGERTNKKEDISIYQGCK